MYEYQREKIYKHVYQDINTRVKKLAYASSLCLLSYLIGRLDLKMSQVSKNNA